MNHNRQNIFLKHTKLFSIIIMIMSLFLVIIISEGILYLLKFDNEYSQMKRFSCKKADWWNNDTILGPRFVQNRFNKLDKALAPQWYYERLKVVNQQGYCDKKNFTNLSPDTKSIKVLFVGDSFTWGASSDVDSSYVEVFEQRFKKNYPAVVWNTGIPATGTNFDLFITKKFLPLQKTNIVVLGFFAGNDFADNLIPFDRLLFSNKASCLNCYRLDDSFNPVKISVWEAYKDATGSYPVDQLNFFQREVIIKSRLLPLVNNATEKIKRLYFRITNKNVISRREYSYQLTKSYLEQLKNYVESNNAELIVLLIPNMKDIKKKSANYLKAVDIFKMLNINYIEVTDKLNNIDYVQNKYDGHWNNRGHNIAGTILSGYITNMLRLQKHNNNITGVL